MKTFKELAEVLNTVPTIIEGRTAKELEIEGQLEAYFRDIPEHTSFESLMKLTEGDIEQ